MIDLFTQRHALYALLAAALFGVSAPIAKALGAEMSPILLAGLLYLGSGTALAVWLAWRRAQGVPSDASAPLTAADRPWLFGSVLAGGICGPLALMWGLQTTSGASASLLLSLEGVLTTLIAAGVFREAVDRRVWLAVGMTVLASALLASPQAGTASLAGSLAVAAACLFWAIDNNLTRMIAGGDPVRIAMYKGLVAGAFNLLLALALGHSLPAWPAAAAAGLVGAASYGLSLVLFIVALRHLGSARTASHFGTAPFFGAGFAVLFMGEPGSWWLLGAVVLVGLATLLVLTERHCHDHQHEALEHEHFHEHHEHHDHVHLMAWNRQRGHSHVHRHTALTHSHPHLPDIHHRHRHET